jgi:hypothetical protein
MYSTIIITCNFQDSTDQKFNFDTKSQLIWLDMIMMIFQKWSTSSYFRHGHKKRNLALQLMSLLHTPNTERPKDVPSIHFTIKSKKKSRKSSTTKGDCYIFILFIFQSYISFNKQHINLHVKYMLKYMLLTCNLTCNLHIHLYVIY